jgi:hypothetical protein
MNEDFSSCVSGCYVGHDVQKQGTTLANEAVTSFVAQHLHLHDTILDNALQHWQDLLSDI